MNKLFRNLCAAALSGCLLCLPAGSLLHAGAAGTDDFRYTLRSDGTVEIFCNDKNITSAEIPAAIDGHTVTALGDSCFAECAALTEVTIPDTVTELGKYAFYGCSSLTEMHLPASVTSIGSYAFDTTEHMTAFTVDDGNPSYQSIEGVLYDKTGSTLLKYPESKPDTTYAVPDTCREIREWSCIGAVYLEQIDLKQVQTIGEDAFYYCIALKDITIPEGVQELPGAVFGCCADLEKVTLPGSIQSLGENCFYSCVSLRDINLPEGLQKLGACTFCHCTALQTLVIPESLTTVNAYCMGYLYNQETESYDLQENFTLYVYKNSVAWKYAATNHIAYEIIRNNTVFYLVCIAVCIVLIILFSVIIIKLLKHQKGGTAQDAE